MGNLLWYCFVQQSISILKFSSSEIAHWPD